MKKKNKNKREAELDKTEKKPNFKPFVIFKSSEFLKGPILTEIGYTVMSFVTVEKKTKTNENKTRNENKYEKNRASGKTRQKKDKLNIELFVMLNLRS